MFADNPSTAIQLTLEFNSEYNNLLKERDKLNELLIDPFISGDERNSTLNNLHLVNLKIDQIKVVVHPESIIHSMISYIDGSTVALLSDHDMRIPISYALNWPNRVNFNLKLLKNNRT